MKILIFDIFYDKEKAGFLYKIDDYFITSLIVLNIVAVMAETFKDFYIEYENYFFYFELFSVFAFTLEYFLRIWVSDLRFPELSKFRARLKYIFSIIGLVDLLAILPFYLHFIFAVDGRLARIFRLFRLFRIFKLSHYSNSLNLLFEIFAEKKKELIVTITTIFILLLFSSALMFELENEVQPVQFPNIFATFWWAIATLTTIGYGDVYPVTAMGKFLASLTAIFGIGLVAIPTSILSVGFLSKITLERKEEICPHCGKKVHDKKH